MNQRVATIYQRIQAFSMASGLLFMLFPVVAFVISSVGFVLGYPITVLHLPVSFLVDVLVCYWILSALHEFKLAYFISALVFFVVGFIAGAAHLTYIFDSSYDGMWYHQEAVLQFAKGWNPYHQDIPNTVGTELARFYDTHYPKAAWIAESVVYTFTHRIESAKIIQVLTSIGLLFSSLTFLLQWRFLPGWVAIVMALLIGFNPVSVYQSYSFYLDGQLGAVLMCMIITLLASLIWNSRVLLWVALGLFAYLANLKFTGLVYGAIVLGAYFGYHIWKRRSDWKYYFVSIGVASIVSVFLLGYPTYVTNWKNNHHPFYPIMGPNNQGDEIAKVPQSADFEHLNRFEKFYKATFAEPIWCRAPLSTKPKNLFKPTYDRYYFTRADFEISGFGPFYAEAFIFLFLGVLILVLIRVPYKVELAIIAGVILCSVFINSEAWYSRYAPQFWLIGLLLVFGLLQHRIARYYAYFLIATLVFNLFMLSGYYFRPHILESRAQQAEINTLKKLNQPARILDSWPITFDVRSKELGLNIELIPSGNVDTKEFRPFTGLSQEWAAYDTLQMHQAKLLP